MSKSFKVLWTENSVLDLQRIKSFISEDSVEKAEAWVLKLYNSGVDLSKFPNRGRIVPEFNQENLRELLIENYRLVYRIKNSSIEIISVFEGHRKLNKKDFK